MRSCFPTTDISQKRIKITNILESLALDSSQQRDSLRVPPASNSCDAHALSDTKEETKEKISDTTLGHSPPNHVLASDTMAETPASLVSCPNGNVTLLALFPGQKEQDHHDRQPSENVAMDIDLDPSADEALTHLIGIFNALLISESVEIPLFTEIHESKVQYAMIENPSRHVISDLALYIGVLLSVLNAFDSQMKAESTIQHLLSPRDIPGLEDLKSFVSILESLSITIVALPAFANAILKVWRMVHSRKIENAMTQEFLDDFRESSMGCQCSGVCDNNCICATELHYCGPQCSCNSQCPYRQKGSARFNVYFN